MTAHDLLERRAERGIPRGPAGVWFDAQRSATPAQPSPRSPSVLWFRLAVVLSVLVAAGAVGWLATHPQPFNLDPANDGVPAPSDPELSDPAEADDDRTTDGQFSREQPDRLVVEGMDLAWIQAPFDFADDNPNFVANSGFEGGEDVETLVFANAEDPFGGVIVSLELLEGGGFQPWGANLGQESLESFTRHLSRDGDLWVMAPNSGLVEVARFTANQEDPFLFGWQFNFEDGADAVTWQAEPHNGAGPWIWISRNMVSYGGNAEPVSVVETEVLGRSGLIIDCCQPDSDEVVWVDGEFVYRLMASHVENDTALARPASEAIARLKRVDEATWDDLVADADAVSLGQKVTFGAQVVGVLAWVVSAGFFLGLRPRRLALLGPVVAVGWFAVGPLEPWETLLLVVALAVAWWWVWRQRRTAKPEAGSEDSESAKLEGVEPGPGLQDGIDP